MPAAIFNENFYSLRQPAWHGLGIVSEEEHTALQIWDQKLAEPFDITVEDLFINEAGFLSEGEMVPSGLRAVVRQPTPSVPEYKVLGTVGSEYELVPPREFCEIWDRATSKHVETLGVLGEGETLFISSKLKPFDIVSEEIQPYLLATSPYTPGSSIGLRITPVRVVCQNTLNVAKRQASQTYRVAHKEGVAEQTETWLRLMMESVEGKLQMVQESFSTMAQIEVPTESIEALLTGVYPDPKRFRATPDPAINEKRQAYYEENLRSAKRSRTAVQEVFEGVGVGQSGNNTVWHLYNAVAEFEQYKPNRKPESAAKDMLIGNRAKTIEDAFTGLLQYAQQESL